MPVAYRTVLTINNHLETDLYNAEPYIKFGFIDGVLPDYIRSGSQQTVEISAPEHFAGSSGRIFYRTHKKNNKNRKERLAFEFKCIHEEANYVKFSSTMPNELVAQIDPYSVTDHPLYASFTLKEL